jgi:hypothetical protein
LIEENIKRSPLGRLVTLRRNCPFGYVFARADASSGMTGQTIYVDAGSHADGLRELMKKITSTTSDAKDEWFENYPYEEIDVGDSASLRAHFDSRGYPCICGCFR